MNERKRYWIDSHALSLELPDKTVGYPIEVYIAEPATSPDMLVDMAGASWEVCDKIANEMHKAGIDVGDQVQVTVRRVGA